MDWIVHEVAKSRIWLSDFHFTIPFRGDTPWWLSSRVCLQCGRPRFNPWVKKIPWRRKWQPTPVFLPGKSLGWRSLVGYSPWGCKESDTDEWLHFTSSLHFSGGSAVENLLANAGAMSLSSDPGRSHMQQSSWACTPQLLSLCSRASTSEAHVP